MTPQGQQAYQQMLQTVRSEPFWRQHLDSNTIYIFPDLSGSNRYSGYTQKGTGQTPEGLTQASFVIHISKDALEAGQLAESATTLIHELSHTLHSTNVTARSLAPFLQTLSTLIADHPQIAALRQGASDPAQAREAQVERIRQALYEQTGYAEAEIFVHLQQLTHQPSVQIQGQTVEGSRYILAQVEFYAEQLKRIGLPPRMLRGILESLSRRVAILYDRRIAAAPANSKQRRLLELNKEQALAILQIASPQ
jgi:hypothetical protein